MSRIAVIYYSSTGNTYQLATAIEVGARAAGAETRLRRVRELAPEEAIATNQGWATHRAATAYVPEAVLDDLEWADGVIFGTPTRFGLPSAQLKQFIDTAGPLWQQGKLVDKAVSAFTGAYNRHAGHETTLTALNNVFVHWGAVIVPLGFTDPAVFAADAGNPYGVSWQSGGTDRSGPDETTLAVARHQGGRVARIAGLLAAGR